MRVLITGGAGFIGSHIAEYFQGKADVRVFDSLRSGFRKNLDGLEVEFIEGDIRDRESNSSKATSATVRRLPRRCRESITSSTSPQ